MATYDEVLREILTVLGMGEYVRVVEGCKKYKHVRITNDESHTKILFFQMKR